MKVKAQIYRGIEFICVSDLPAEQQLLLQHAQEPERIKILMDGKIISNCVQYKEYGIWFTTVYERSVAKLSAKVVKEETFQSDAVLVRTN